MTETTDTLVRGRPRPNATIELDERVFAFLTASSVPQSKTAVATALSIKPSLAYLALWRLRNDGRVVNGRAGERGGHTWSVAPAPAPAEAVQE